jgi:hypothetical protein
VNIQCLQSCFPCQYLAPRLPYLNGSSAYQYTFKEEERQAPPPEKWGGAALCANFQ